MGIMEGKAAPEISQKFSDVSPTVGARSLAHTHVSRTKLIHRCTGVSTHPSQHPRIGHSGQLDHILASLTAAALLANWKVWPLIQAVNFKLMPIQYRVPFQSTCGIAWTLYLSLLNAK